MQLDEAVNKSTYVEKNDSLPDLNMPQSVTAPTQESLTESQQMQLRAQIIVYGSLMYAYPCMLIVLFNDECLHHWSLFGLRMGNC
jgi:hypothetical protein